MTCHGCKWLDEVKNQPDGSGYCSHVVRSKDYEAGMRVRSPQKMRCELYDKGSFKNRFRGEEDGAM